VVSTSIVSDSSSSNDAQLKFLKSLGTGTIYVCIYIYMLCIYTEMWLYLYLYMYLCIYTTSIVSVCSSSNDAQLKFLESLGTGSCFDYISVYICICINVHIDVYVFTYKHICLFMFEDFCKYIFACIYIFIVGDCFDVFHEGVWEVAFVENISDFGTEIEINIVEKGIVKWLGIGEGSADSGPSFMAPYGTRVGALIEPAISVDGILDLTGDNDIEDQVTSGNTVDDVTWRFDISVGTLIDGKDRQNCWYQACVMEIKHEEVQPVPIPPPTVNSKLKELKSIIKTTPLKHAKNVQINEAVEMKYINDDNSNKNESQPLSANQSDIEMEGTRSPTDEVRLRFEGVTTKGNSDNTVHSHSNGVDGNDSGEKSSLCFADIETEFLSNVDEPSNGHVDNTPIVIEKDIMNIDNKSDIVKVKTVARVSFLGCAEFNDVWVDVDSDRIAQFNTQSEGRRGDIPIRESVIFIVSKKAKEVALGNDVDIDIGADVFAAVKSEQDGFFHSPYYVDIINAFGDNKGFEGVFQFLAMQSNIPESVSTTLSLSIITALGSTCSVLTENFLGYILNREVINSMVHSVRQVSKRSHVFIYVYVYICICI
jgi:hypothetical protein